MGIQVPAPSQDAVIDMLVAVQVRESLVKLEPACKLDWRWGRKEAEERWRVEGGGGGGRRSKRKLGGGREGLREREEELGWIKEENSLIIGVRLILSHPKP